MTLQEFFRLHDHEKWSGDSSAFKNGAKCAIAGRHRNPYQKNKQFQKAWDRGHQTMTNFLSMGGLIDAREETSDTSNAGRAGEVGAGSGKRDAQLGDVGAEGIGKSIASRESSGRDCKSGNGTERTRTFVSKSHRQKERELTMTLQEVDRKLDGKPTKAELLALKDAVLRAMGNVPPKSSHPLMMRLARINMQIKSLENRDNPFENHFFEAARELLEAPVFSMLKRAAKARQDAAGAEQGLTLALEIEQPKEKEQPNQPKIKPIATLAKVANARSVIKFDPATLFREFGRARVLNTWSSMLPEERPETANEMRQVIRSKMASGE